MNEEEIADNPSFRKLKDDAEQFRGFARIWPVLKPFARMLGVDVVGVDRTLEKATELAKKVDRMTAMPDKFNDTFSERGWILFDSMDPDAAEQAIAIAEAEGLDQAERYLVKHFSPGWVETHINWLRYIRGFRERFELATRALEDYKAGRYYASVLVTLTLIDGWVNELNIVDFQRNGFFSENSQLVAWDSIAAHPKGLTRLQTIFGKTRKMTRTEEISIPYRHGIIHGMDLGYNNQYVAAKCWVALFAVRDWAIKVAKDELSPPELEPEVEKTLWESIESYQKTRGEIERIKQWQPRQIIVGESLPAIGQPQDYPPGTPEQKAVEFLHYWLKGNYGYMAKCYAPMLSMQPGSVREQHQHQELLDFRLVKVNDISPAVADVKAQLNVRIGDRVTSGAYEFRLVANSREGELAYIESEDTVWGVTTWRRA